MRVYYFTKASHAIDDITYRHIKLSRFSEVNDVYELLAVAVDAGKENIRKALLLAKEDNNKNNAFVSFSESFDNPLMWGHYADKFKGICLGVDFPQERLLKMDYKSGCPDVDWDQPMDVLGAEKLRWQLLRTKFEDWHYEQEWRHVVSLLDKSVVFIDGMPFVELSSDIRFCEVILGCNFEENIQAVKNALEESGQLQSVSVFTSRISFRDFKIQKEIITWDAL